MKAMAAGNARAVFSALLGAALLAALLWAPGEARAVEECGDLSPDGSTATCTATTYSDGIFYGGADSADWTGGNNTVNIEGSSTTTTITAGATQAVGVYLLTSQSGNRRINLNMGGATGGTAHVIDIVQGTNTVAGVDRNNGIYLEMRHQRNSPATIDVKAGVTIGSATTPMKQNGIWLQLQGTGSFWGSGQGTIDSAATIYATKRGILVGRRLANTTNPTTITNSGAINSGEEGIYLWYPSYTRPFPTANRNDYTGSADITNSGTIAVSGAYAGIHMNYNNDRNATIANMGAISAPMGSGIWLSYASAAGTVSVRNSGTIAAAGVGIRVERRGPGPATVQVTGGSVAVSGRNGARDARTPAVSLPAHAVELRQMGTGDATIELDSGATLASRHNAGMFATLGASNSAGQIRVTQEGEIFARTGVLAQVPRAAGIGEMRMAADQPLIDITWSGSFAAGTTAQSAPNDDDRFAAANAAQVLAFDREAAAGAGSDGIYGGAAGIEAYALSWRDVVAQVARGDDPGTIDATAQTNLLSTTHADSRRADILAQFRAALGNDDIVVAPAVLTAIGTSATTAASQLTDTQIVTWLSAAGRRTLLRNILAQGFSDAEKEALKALANGADVDTALGDAGFQDNTEDDTDYWTRVQMLLDRYNPGNIRIAMTAGSIASRGDGIRAYYATAHDNNGAIEVTVAAGTTVTGGRAGIRVANAGLDVGADGTADTADDILKQTVTVHGMVTGGTDAAVHLVGGGTLTLGEMGALVAGAGQPAILVNDPGRSVIVIDGRVTGSAGADAAVDLSGGATVTVGLNGAVDANGARRTIRGSDDLAIAVTVFTNAMIVYREDAEEQHARMAGTYRPQNVAEVVFREQRDGALTGYSRTLPVHRVTGELDTSSLPARPRPPEPEPDPVPTPDPDPTTPDPDPITPGTDPTTPGAGPTTPEIGPETGPTPAPAAPVTFACRAAQDHRCRLYEALPSLLLAMSALPSYPERMQTPRDAYGGWARLETSRGVWQAGRATTGTLAYNHRWNMGQAGVDMAVGENTRLGLSLHALDGKASMSGIGAIELNGMGAGISATWLDEMSGIWLDAQARTTAYDASISSAIHGDLLKDDAAGIGWGLAVDVGHRLPVAWLSMSPHAGLAWSRFDLEDFTDLETAGGQRARVRVADADSLKGRLGVTLETELDDARAPGLGMLFGALAVEREFSDRTQVKVGTETLKTELRPTTLRLGAGGVLNLNENTQARTTLGYWTSGIGSDGYNAALELQVRF